jgi:A/G-specific adenine glycosylase
LRRGVAFVARRGDGAILLRRRPERGLLGGMMEVPSTSWREAPWEPAEARAEAPVAARWRAIDGVVRHTFTHFHLELAVLAGTAGDTEGGLWQPVERLDEVALPTLMKKVVRHALAAGELTSAARSG